MLVYDTMTWSQLLVHVPVIKRLTRSFVSVVSADSVAFCWSAPLPAASDSNKIESSFWRLLSETCSRQIQQIQIQACSPSHWTGKQNSYCLVCLRWKSMFGSRCWHANLISFFTNLLVRPQEKHGRIRMKIENHFCLWIWVGSGLLNKKNEGKIEKLGQIHIYCESKENSVIKILGFLGLNYPVFCPMGIYFLEQSHNAGLDSCNSQSQTISLQSDSSSGHPNFPIFSPVLFF